MFDAVVTCNEEKLTRHLKGTNSRKIMNTSFLTSMHSSRMRTARELTVFSGSLPPGGGLTQYVFRGGMQYTDLPQIKTPFPIRGQTPNLPPDADPPTPLKADPPQEADSPVGCVRPAH